MIEAERQGAATPKELPRVNDQVSSTSHSDSSNLSNRVFSDPVEYLKVLRADVAQISQSNNHAVSKADLQIYGQTESNDPTMRAAADIAANHFDDVRGLSKMLEPSPPHGYANDHFNDDGKPMNVLTTNDIDIALAMAQGKTSGYIAGHELEAGLNTVMYGAVTVAAGAATGTAFVGALPFALPFGALTAAGAYGTVKSGINMYDLPGQIKDLAKQDQKTLSGWSEFK